MNILSRVHVLIIGMALISAGTLQANAPASARPYDRSGIKTIPLNVKFEFGKADLGAANMSDAEFKDVVQELKNYPFAKLEIEGYTDSTGPEAFNQKLSEKRAQAIRTCFVDKYGIAPERISIKAYGEKNPEVPNLTPEGRQINRRALARVYRLDLQPNGQNGHNL